VSGRLGNSRSKNPPCSWSGSPLQTRVALAFVRSQPSDRSWQQPLSRRSATELRSVRGETSLQGSASCHGSIPRRQGEAAGHQYAGQRLSAQGSDPWCTSCRVVDQARSSAHRTVAGSTGCQSSQERCRPCDGEQAGTHGPYYQAAKTIDHCRASPQHELTVPTTAPHQRI